MPTTSWLYPTSATTLARSGSSGSWSDVTNILADDTSYASLTHYSFNPFYTPYLVAKGFEIADHVPLAAEILGIELDIARYEGQSNDNITDSELKLYNGGTLIGDNKGEAPEWSTGMQTISYGGAADLWGATLTPAIVRDANFGAALSIYASINLTTCYAYVDFMRMRITWRPLVAFEAF